MVETPPLYENMLDWDSDQIVPTLPQISSSLIAAQLISVQIMRLFSCRAWGAEKLLGTSGGWLRRFSAAATRLAQLAENDDPILQAARVLHASLCEIRIRTSIEFLTVKKNRPNCGRPKVGTWHR
jgi:hypothetical protein